MRVRVGIVSFAHAHAPPYASVLASLDSASFVGISDDDASRGRQAAQRFGVSFFEDARRLFDAVDAVVICSENSSHARDAIAALESGDRKSTRLNSSHANISYAVFCLKKKKKK